ncbi:DUF2240 domain-containing protein [Halobacteriales archaeon QS_8_65_32]|nr:MAG: DUF2240 domain-containing protein [Halobacteriales archaeon QS_8_65_32]
MSLEATVAAPFRGRGRDALAESEFVVSLSLDRGWFSPNQAKRLLDVAAGEGLIARDGGDLVPTFDADSVTIPEGFTPNEDLLRGRSVFEQVLDACVEAGFEKRETVAGINRLQRTLAVTVEAAAVLYAHRRGVDVRGAATRACTELAESE